MSGGGDRAGGEALNEREAAILRSVIQEHVVTGEPIASSKLSRGVKLDLSPATIRATMAALEERGLLQQPHTSAGRVPTSRAYRLYVDRMIRRPRVGPAQAEAIERALLDKRGGIAEFLTEASRQLSRFSNQVGVVLAPELKRVIVEHVEFVRLDARRAVAVIVARSGVVNNRIVDLDEPLEQDELDRIGRFLTDEVRGKTIPEMRSHLRDTLAEERALYDKLVARGLELGRRSVEHADEAADVFVEGTANLLDSPELADPETMRALMQALERRTTMIDMLGRILDERGGVQVVIGEENPTSDLAACSLVATSYGSGERVMGTLGIVGPTRMEYARAIALVDYLGRVLGRYFSGDEN